MSGQVFHGPLLESHTGFKIKKILERTRENSAGKHPGAEIVRDYSAILRDEEIELVIVNTPDHLHHQMASAAIAAGKNVVVEKPFTLKSEDGEELITLARKQGVILSVFHNRRWDGDFLTVKEIIHSGKLGRLVDFESRFDRYRTSIQPSWKDLSNQTGTLYNLGSHLIDQALFLFGMPDALFCDVRMLRDGARTDDSYDLFLLYPAIKCLLRSSYLVREPLHRFSLNGVDGSYMIRGQDPQEAAMKNGIIPGSDAWRDLIYSDGRINSSYFGSELNGPYRTRPGNYPAYYDLLHDAIRKGGSPPVRPEEALNVVRIIEAAYESSRLRKVITFHR